MDRQLGQLVRLVDDLLDVSRITHNKIALTKERVDLARIIGHAVEASLPQAESLGHQMKVTLPSGPIYLEADPSPPGPGIRQPAQQRMQVHAARRQDLGDG
jgi:signal transduction histidine kinase